MGLRKLATRRFDTLAEAEKFSLDNAANRTILP
jgi:hypothetical protein